MARFVTRTHEVMSHTHAGAEKYGAGGESQSGSHCPIVAWVADRSGWVEKRPRAAGGLNYEDAERTRDSKNGGCHNCLLAGYPGPGDRRQGPARGKGAIARTVR